MPDADRVSNTGGKAPIYRASCDSCKQAKVRCSQTKQSCARCVKHKIPCVYGISKRAGKHSAERYNTMTRSADSRLSTAPPTTPSTSPSVENLSTPSTADTGHTSELSSGFSPQNLNSHDLLRQQQKQWEFDHIFAVEPDNPFEAPFDYTNQAVFGVDEIYASHSHHQPPGAYNAILPGVFDAELVPNAPDGRIKHLSSDESCASSVSHVARSHSHCFASFGPCQCSENIIMQLSSLPVFLHHERFPFDIELVQFQEAIRLCAGALACTRAGKDYTSVLTISMLIARIISVFQRGGASAGSNDDFLAIPMVGNPSPATTPKLSFGIYQMGPEEESKLKQEVWWMQFKKVESLVADFREMVTKLKEHQMYQDMVMTAASEKILSLLDQKAQSVKREWVASRDRS